jgi:hypothetical protein
MGTYDNDREKIGELRGEYISSSVLFFLFVLRLRGFVQD